MDVCKDLHVSDTSVPFRSSSQRFQTYSRWSRSSLRTSQSTLCTWRALEVQGLAVERASYSTQGNHAETQFWSEGIVQSTKLS